MADCEHLPNCGFCKKYANTKNLVVRGFISMYCKSVKQSECKRKEYKRTHGAPPPDDMMPSGQIIR